MEFRGQERQFAETLTPLLQYQRTKVPVNCDFSGLLSISKQMEGKRSKRHKSGKDKRKKSVPRKSTSFAVSLLVDHIKLRIGPRSFVISRHLQAIQYYC